MTTTRIRTTKTRRGRPGPPMSTGRALAVALVLFAMLCGLTLVVAPQEDRHGLPPAQAARVKRALEGIDQATHALEAANYGETRDHLRAARSALREVTGSE